MGRHLGSFANPLLQAGFIGVISSDECALGGLMPVDIGGRIPYIAGYLPPEHRDWQRPGMGGRARRKMAWISTNSV
jgi:hypothetical protein